MKQLHRCVLTFCRAQPKQNAAYPGRHVGEAPGSLERVEITVTTKMSASIHLGFGKHPGGFPRAEFASFDGKCSKYQKKKSDGKISE